MDLGLLKKVRKQERLSLERHEHSIQCLILHPSITALLIRRYNTTFYTSIKFDQGVTSLVSILFRAENSLSKGKSIYYLLLIIVIFFGGSELGMYNQALKSNVHALFQDLTFEQP